MSNVYQDLCDFDLAIECEERRMKRVERISDINGQIKCAYTLGCLNQLIGETRISLEYYEKAVINMKMKISTFLSVFKALKRCHFIDLRV